jgi:hypothetical protein
MLRTIALFPKNWFIIVPLLLISGAQWAILFHVRPPLLPSVRLDTRSFQTLAKLNREYRLSVHDMILLRTGVSSKKSSQFGLTWCTCIVSVLGLLPELTGA